MKKFFSLFSLIFLIAALALNTVYAAPRRCIVRGNKQNDEIKEEPALKEFKDFEITSSGCLDLMPEPIESSTPEEEEGAFYVVEVDIDKDIFLKKYKVEKIVLNGKPVEDKKIIYKYDKRGFRFHSFDYKIGDDNVIDIYIKNLENNENYIKYNMYDLVKHDYSNNCNDINNINEPNDTCYVIYTSGTTGKPKGTLNSFNNIYNFIRSHKENDNKKCSTGYCNYDLMMEELNVRNILAISNFSFDASLIEIFIGLIHGLEIILVDEILIENIDSLSKCIIENKVEFIQITPSRLKLLIENHLFRKFLKQIKTIAIGGEALSMELCKNINQISNCKIFNEYGPTECAICCCFKEIKINENILTIGRPICNCKIYILDKYKKPVPIGIEGEIYIGGYGVGKGYLNRPELTKEKFVENPFNLDGDEHNRIMYRTGDLGR